MLPADRITKREMILHVLNVPMRRMPTKMRALGRVKTSREIDLHCHRVLCTALVPLIGTMGTSLHQSMKGPMASESANSHLTTGLPSFMGKLFTCKTNTVARYIDSNPARPRLENLNSLGRSYAFGSELTPVRCRNQDNPVKYNKGPEDKMKVIKDEFHSLFIKIGQLGRQLHEQGMDKDASPIFKELMIALERYHGLGDDRKYNALCNIAEFYRVKGDQDEHEWVLTKAVEAHDPSLHPNDPCPLLAASFSETSGRAADDLVKLWKKSFMVAGETSLAIPPIQRSAQQGNAGVASILLDRPNSIAHSPPALFNQEGLHIAATRGNEQSLKNFLRAGAQVDAPDLHNHTALFLAAARGHEGCCAELINWKADVNRRDRHGTTILEVAAGAGHLKVVQRLVSAGAEVNPECVCCTSTPLQAAIENAEYPIEVALYLMGKDGDVSIQRKDGKNAIDLAERRCAFLAQIMRQKEFQGPQNFFGPPQTFSFDQSHLDFGPDLL